MGAKRTMGLLDKLFGFGIIWSCIENKPYVICITHNKCF